MFMGMALKAGKQKPLREKKDSGALTRHRQ